MGYYYFPRATVLYTKYKNRERGEHNVGKDREEEKHKKAKVIR